MPKLAKQLPQLDPLVAFEAAARHASFALAAQELNITAPAISQKIRNLEASLGVQLFDRGHRSVQLTDRGRSFQNSVTKALTHLANATAELRVDADHGHLKLATDLSIPPLWLLPRLHLFEHIAPGCTVQITATDHQSELLAADFDFAIIHGRGEWVGYQSQLLFSEEIFPVCAPQFLDQHLENRSIEFLPDAPLLDLDYAHWHWMNWAIWLTEQGLPVPHSPRKLRINSYPMVIDAACRGHGIALGWRHLVDQQIADGTLVRIGTQSVTTDYGYHLIWPHNAKLSPSAVRFQAWLAQ